MHSPLDQTKYWLLESSAFNGNLELSLVELTTPKQPEELVVGEVDIGMALPMTVTPSSRRLRVSFDEPLAHQIVDESYAGVDRTTRRLEGDEGRPEVFESSSFLEHLRKEGLLEQLLDEPLRHYRIFTEDWVIDVASTRPPRFEPVGA